MSNTCSNKPNVDIETSSIYLNICPETYLILCSMSSFFPFHSKAWNEKCPMFEFILLKIEYGIDTTNRFMFVMCKKCKYWKIFKFCGSFFIVVLFNVYFLAESKAFGFQIAFIPILTYSHECCVITKRVRSRVQAAEIGFLQKVKGLSLLDTEVKRTDILHFFNIEPLLFRIAIYSNHNCVGMAMWHECFTNEQQSN